MGIVGLENGFSVVELMIFAFIGVNMVLSGSVIFGIGVKKLATVAKSEQVPAHKGIAHMPRALQRLL